MKTDDFRLDDWLTRYQAGQAVAPLIADIKTGRVHKGTVLYAIQQFSDDEKVAMGPALDTLMEVLQETD